MSHEIQLKRGLKMEEQNKLPRGRPPIADHLKKKNTTRTMRVPNEVIDHLKIIVKAYNEGAITAGDIRALANKGA